VNKEGEDSEHTTLLRTMDSDRWSMAWALQSKPSSPSSSTRQQESRKSAPSPLPVPVVVNRYQHDMEQAKAMRKSVKSTAASNSNSNSNASISREEDVRLGFLGLEQAEEQAEKGNLSEALRLYELSIELLIRFLRDGQSPDNSPIDRSTVEARIQAALSEAEAIKPMLAAQKAKSTTEYVSPLSSLGATLQSALRRGTAMVQGQGRPTLTLTPAPAPARQSTKLVSSSRNNTAGIRKPAKRTAGNTTNTLPRNRTVPAPATSIPPTSSTVVDLTTSDAFVQTVESDLMVDPSSLSPVSWDDIAGLTAVKQSLQESAVLPLQRPDLFTGLRRPQNVLLWGPPGTGKTMLVRAVARESGSSLFVCSAAAMTSKWMGEAEKLVRALFRVAQDRAPSIVFLDEMDALLSGRKSDEHEASRRLKTEFMVQMDGICVNTVNGNGNNTKDSRTRTSNKSATAASSTVRHVLMLGCTNCPWDIDSAVLRRFPRRILVPLPDEAARRGLLQHLLQKAGKHSLTSRHVTKLVERTQGFSCSDISAIAVQASFGPLRSLGGMQAVRNVRVKDVRPITLGDFESTIVESTKSVSAEQLRRYDDWQRQQAAS
jgi:ATP-dependent 26S proteasome regulatory subunit